MAQAYNPYQKRTINSQPSSYSAVPTGASTNRIGYLDADQIGTGQWGTGQSFQGAGRTGVVKAIGDSMSTANAEDYAGMDELRDYYRNALADLPGQSADQISSFDTQAQRGLSNNLSLLKNSRAGTGSLGSRQYAGAQGDLASRANSDYLTGLINARADAVNQAGKIGAGLGDVQNRGLDERRFQMQQGQTMSNQILALMGLDMGRDARLSEQDFRGDESDKAKQYDFWKTNHNTASEGAGSLVGMSDMRVKKDIRAVDGNEVLSIFRSTQPYRYSYKEERFGKGERISPMAQEMIKNGMGDCVFETVDGLAVDYGKAMGRMFAAISALTREVDRLKGRG